VYEFLSLPPKWSWKLFSPCFLLFFFFQNKLNATNVRVYVTIMFRIDPSSRSLAGIVGSNPTAGMVVCFLWVLCVVR
jgi:hypothetical protein